MLSKNWFILLEFEEHLSPHKCGIVPKYTLPEFPKLPTCIHNMIDGHLQVGVVYQQNVTLATGNWHMPPGKPIMAHEYTLIQLTYHWNKNLIYVCKNTKRLSLKIKLQQFVQ